VLFCNGVVDPFREPEFSWTQRRVRRKGNFIKL
jgi:hypothetical protein